MSLMYTLGQLGHSHPSITRAALLYLKVRPDLPYPTT